MVELRIGVDDATRADGLMRRLSALYGRSAISFDRSRNEVRIQSEWESRAVVHVFAAHDRFFDCTNRIHRTTRAIIPATC